MPEPSGFLILVQVHEFTSEASAEVNLLLFENFHPLPRLQDELALSCGNFCKVFGPKIILFNSIQKKKPVSLVTFICALI